MDRQPPFNFLPKELLINIVSRLPFKDAVRTSVLAKHWINIWRYSTNMELNQSYFRNPQSLSDPGSIESVRFKSFSNKFMNYFLGSELESFTLAVNITDSSLTPMLKRAVLFAVKQRVKHLTLDLTQLQLKQQQPLHFKTLEILELPNEFYDYLTKIESLKLSSVSISLLGCCCFTALRNVTFQGLRFWKAELRHLVAEAPVLEDLRLHKCVCYKLKLASHSLRSLALEECDIVKDTVSLATPNLKSFLFSGRACKKLDLKSAAKRLKSASIHFDLEPLKRDFDENLCCHQFMNFWCVKDLTVSSYVLQLLQRKMGDFNHHQQPSELKHLTIRADSSNRSVFQGCIFFVKSCPDMETLTIDISRTSEHINDPRAPLDSQPSRFETFNNDQITCLVRSLKIVELRGYDGSCLLVEFLSYILKNGKVLEKIILKKSTTEISIKELQYSEKASPNAQIYIEV